MKVIRAELLTIGDEILYGQIVDTNSQWMSTELTNAGIRVVRRTSVGDTREAILSGIKAAEEIADVILMTGGLGPTKDDITKKTLADYFGSEMSIDQAVLEHVTRLFTARGRAMNELTAQQANVPHNCTVIHNAVGTAPGMWFEKNGKVFVSMPGVPHEMKKMMTDLVLPKLQQHFNTPVITHRIIKVVNIAESSLAELIEPWEDALPEHIRLAYLPGNGMIKLRLTGTGSDRDMLNRELQEQIDTLVPLIEKFIVAYDDDEIEDTVGKLLLRYGKTISTAESCTGGLVAHKISHIAGASRYFNGSVVAYSNAAKVDLLGVDAQLLDEHGAVSEYTAMEMARNVRQRFGTDIGIATTGVAGPTGGTPEKPVGTVWIAYSDAEHTVAKRLSLTQDRQLNIQMTANFILNFVRLKLTGQQAELIVK